MTYSSNDLSNILTWLGAFYWIIAKYREYIAYLLGESTIDLMNALKMISLSDSKDLRLSSVSLVMSLVRN